MPLFSSKAATRDRLITILSDAPVQPFPHYWESCVGSDRAAVSMRADWRRDLALVRDVCGFRSVRFHGILDDEMGLCREIGPNGPILNFLYIDQMFDMLLNMGVRPLVEISFMPRPMASGPATVFWYEGNTTPPRDMKAWSALIGDLTAHLIARYGRREIERWRFEVWNEPNLNSWSGTKAQYFELYAATARAIKAAGTNLQVGGPATAHVSWLPEFIAFCHTQDVPLDFVSTHVYDNDSQDILFGGDRGLSVEQIMPTAIRMARAQIDHSPMPGLPLAITEWASQNPAYICQTIRDCAGLCDVLSYWIFNNTFEENGPIPGYGQIFFGLLEQGGVPRPPFHAFALLHRLGEDRIDTGNAPMIATRRANGSLAIILWNLIPEGATTGPSRDFHFVIDPKAGTSTVTIVDPNRDAAVALWHEFGAPTSPTREQLASLRAAAFLIAKPLLRTSDGELALSLPANAVALIETTV